MPERIVSGQEIDDDDDDALEAANGCGWHDGGCDLAGGVFCDWECPFGGDTNA